MKIKITLALFFILFTFIPNVNAFSPTSDVSGIKYCSYQIDGNTYDSTRYLSAWQGNSVEACNGTIDFSTIEDGIYDINFKSEDKTTPANIFTVTKGKYKIDTKKINCVLNTFTLYGIDNQYYNNGNLYYKKSSDAQGKFSMDITCNDPGHKDYISNIKEINFPKILGTYPKLGNKSVKDTGIKFTEISETKEYNNFILTYEWSGIQTEGTNLLKELTNFSEDHSGNMSTLGGNNTQLVIKDKNNSEVLQTLSVTDIILTGDSTPPDFLSAEYDLGNNANTIGNYNSILSESKFLAALDNRKIRTPEINDDGAGIRPFSLFIEKYNEVNKYREVQYQGSYLFDNGIKNKINQEAFEHDFRDVSNNGDYNSNGYRPYDWYIKTYKRVGSDISDDEICDMVDNCKKLPTPEFKVVANEPVLANSLNNLNDKYSGKVSDYKDEYSFDVSFKDKYDNEIVPVLNVKNISFVNNVTNTLGTDQISSPESGDGVGFSFYDGGNNDLSFLNNNYQSYTKTLTKKSDLDKGQLKVKVKSAVPTYNEYITASDNPGEKNKSIYGDLSAKLKYEKFQINVSTIIGYEGVGEYTTSGDSFIKKTSGATLVSLLPEFTFDPILSFNYIGNIYPLVEGQVKNMALENKVLNSTELDKFNLDIYVGTNNPYLQITDGKLVDGYISKSNWSIINKYNNHKVKDKYQYLPTVDNSTMDYNGSDVFQILPKTLDGITDETANIGLYTILKYKTNSKEVILPGIQTGFKEYGTHTKTDFSLLSKYDNKSSISFSEIQITGISQTKNKGLSRNTDGSIVTNSAVSEFNDFSKISLYDLKTGVKSNLSKYLKGNNINNATIGSDTISDFSNFSDNGLSLKGGDILYIKDRNVEINCGSGNSCMISGKKTIIVDGGNLTINSDMYYDNTNSILGIVLLGNTSNGNTSQLKINENITNGVGIVYSEGPIVSVDNYGKVYNGTNVGTNLKNQLYWKGSFATKNTVGGAISFNIKNSCPYGTVEYETSLCTPEIAQGYDLIYLRRYTVTKDDLGNFIPLNGPVRIAGGVVFDEYGNKSGGIDVLTKTSNFKSPLIIDYDPKLQSNPPYLFEK